MSKYKGKCSECEHRDVVDKKWWGCTTVVCTYNSPMGKALPASENIPAWCPTGGVPEKIGGNGISEADVKRKYIRELELCAQELWHIGKQMNVPRLIGISEELSDCINTVDLAWSIDEPKPNSPKYAIDKFGIAGRLIKDDRLK